MLLKLGLVWREEISTLKESQPQISVVKFFVSNFLIFRVVCGLGVSMVARVFIAKTHMHVRAKNRRLKKRKEGHLVKEILLFVY